MDSQNNAETEFRALAEHLWKVVHTQMQISGIMSMQGMANKIIEEETAAKINSGRYPYFRKEQ